MIGRWRRYAETIVTQALADAERDGLGWTETRMLVGSRYPWGQRTGHPYKIWCDVVRKKLPPKRRVPELTELELR